MGPFTTSQLERLFNARMLREEISTQFTKPRLQKTSSGRWQCIGLGQVRMGDTPAAAYSVWREAAIQHCWLLR